MRDEWHEGPRPGGEQLGCRIVPVTAARQNCSIVWCRQTMRGAIIDPGGEIDRLLDVAEREGVSIEKILITHGHRDHAGGAALLSERLGVPITGPHADDAYWLERLRDGSPGAIPAQSFVPRWLEHGDEVEVGNLRLRAIHCPGHTPGHIVYFHAGSPLLFSGDVLFRGQIGATQLPLGDHLTLLASIIGRIWPLGDAVVIVPGHGSTTTIGHERRANPFVSDGCMAPYRASLMKARPSYF